MSRKGRNFAYRSQESIENKGSCFVKFPHAEIRRKTQKENVNEHVDKSQN